MSNLCKVIDFPQKELVVDFPIKGIFQAGNVPFFFYKS